MNAKLPGYDFDEEHGRPICLGKKPLHGFAGYGFRQPPYLGRRHSWFCLLALLTITLWFSPTGTVMADPWWQAAKQQADQLIPQFMTNLPKMLPSAVVVGLVSTGGVMVLPYSSPSAPAVPDGDSIFMIGSVQKLFGGLLFGQYLASGTVTLDQPVQTLLPEGVKMPVYHKFPNTPITLLELADFSSGLPRADGALAKAVHHCLTQPEVNRAIYGFLNRYHLTNRPGTHYEYSDISAPLLPNLLSTNFGNGQTYPALVQTMFLNELQMTNTGMFLTNGEPHLILGYNSVTGAPGINPTGNRLSLTGYPEMHSTVNDLNRFLAANLGLTTVSFSAAISNSLVPRFKNHPNGDHWTAFFWDVQTNNQIYAKDGLNPDYCYSAFVTMNRETTNGVVILCNSTSSSNINPIAAALLYTLSTNSLPQQ